MLCNRSKIVYFDSFGVQHILEEIKEFNRNKNIIAIENTDRNGVNKQNTHTQTQQTLKE